MKTTYSLSSTILLNIVVATIVSIVLIGGLWTWQQYSTFLQESNQLQEAMLNSYKNLLKIQVQKSADYIEYHKSLTEERLRLSIQEKVYDAYAVSSHLYTKWRDQKSIQEIQNIIRESLRMMRFNQGRGYFFILDLQGTNQLQPDLPEFENKNMLKTQNSNQRNVVSDMINIVRDKEEGFYQYNWTKPGMPQGIYPKIAFVKLFKPYNWIIGTGEYLDDFESSIKRDVLRYIETIKFEKDGYIFVTQWDGLDLTGPAKGRNMLGVTDVNGVHIVQELIKLAKSGDGFLRYVMPKLKGMKPNPKLSYVQGIKDWEWYVGAGIYIDDIEKAVQAKQAETTSKIKNSLTQMAAVLFFLIAFIYLFAQRISSKARNSFNRFTRFFEKGAHESTVIDPNAMEYKEFEKLAHSANDMIKTRMQAKLALVESEEKYRSMMEAMDDPVYICSKDFIVEYMNPAMIKRLGYDATGELCYKAMHALEKECSWCVHETVMKGESIKAEVVSPKDNRIYYVSNSPIFHSHGEISKLTIFRDITEKREMEANLQQSQKMEAIGTLAGGIAHDFNNILFPIIGHTEMLIEDIPEDSPFRDSLNGIYLSALRARDLVQQILAFSRQGTSELKLMKMQPIIKEALKLIRSTIPTTISINQNLQSDCGAVKADPTQIHQIVMNLTTNAYHAMENDGGELKVILKQVELGKQDLILADLTPGSYACLIVSDTGIGITKDVIDKIFDPFFTTKEKGRGTGMGLSVVHGIVKNMNGTIRVYSQPGKETEFHVYLPVVKSAFETQENHVNGPLEGGTECILLIDDEEGIIMMEKQVLERLGYRVTSHMSSTEALDAFKTCPDKFDIVITDMAMPKMSGDKLAIELIKIRHDIPILICTGFSETMTEEKIKSLGIKGLLLKPIIIKDLAQRIRKVLDEN